MNTEVHKRLAKAVDDAAPTTSWTITLVAGGTVTGTIEQKAEVWKVNTGTATAHIVADQIAAITA